MYLCQALAVEPDIELIGVRICNGNGAAGEDHALGWPVVDLPLGSASLSTLYQQQKRRFREMLENYNPDIVHAQGADLAGLLATGCGLPAVVTVHGLLGECAKLQTHPTAKARAILAGMLTERPTVRRATDLISISPYVGQYYQGELKGRVHEIPNAIAPRFFRVPRAPERGRLLFAGRIAKGKGPHDLVHAIARIPDKVGQLILAGATPDPAFESVLRAGRGTPRALRARRDSRACSTNPRCSRSSRVPRRWCCPSYQETAPMVVQQAMAAGLAVVASRVGGIPQQIDHDATGLLFEAGNVDALAGALARLHDEPELASRLAKAGRTVAEQRYGAASVALATRVVYEGIVREAGTRGREGQAT